MPVVHGVRVHEPRHHALVRVHVRCRHVGVGTERVDDAHRIAAGKPLQLTGAHLERVADDAALGAAKRQVHDGALPGHPRGERLHLVEAHLKVEADAALGGPARGVVQDAVPGEDLHFAVVHHDGHGDDDLLLGMP